MKWAAAACTLALVIAAGWYLFLRPESVLRVSADFTTSTGIFAGNKVEILGVPVGRVESVEPRGAVVRVTMALPADTKIPDTAHAYIMSPAVVSDRFVELDPPYTSGKYLDDQAVIPVERAHAPIKWDELVSSMDKLLTAFGPDTGSALHTLAAATEGNGPAFRDAINSIDQATTMVAGDTGDITAALSNLDRLVSVLTTHKSTLDSLATSISQAGNDFATEQNSVATTISQLSTLLTQVSALIHDHGGALTADLANLANTTTMVAAHQADLTELVNVLPLFFDNFSRSVTPDQRIRLRVDVSTNLSQFSTTAALCQRLPIPLCTGAGIVNPIPLPPTLTGGGR